MAPCRCFECPRTLVRREPAVGCWHRLSTWLHRCSEGFPWWQYLWPVSINRTSCFLYAPYSEGRGARAAGATGFWTLWTAPELSPARSTEVKALENLLLRAKTRPKTLFWPEFLTTQADSGVFARRSRSRSEGRGGASRLEFLSLPVGQAGARCRLCFTPR